jgi:hypothetical protein
MITEDDIKGIVAALDSLAPDGDRSDNEHSHITADGLLLAAVDPRIAEAYERLRVRVGGFWYS